MNGGGRLTTHVLDTAHGKPAAGMRIELFRVGDPGDAGPLVEVETNHDGRPPAPLLSGAGMQRGTYRLVFHVGGYFSARAHPDAKRFLEAIRRWQELGLAVEAGFAQLNCLGLLGVTDAETRAVALDARQLFERLGARALLDRLAEVEGTVGSTGPPLRVGEAEVSATPQQ